MAKVGSPVSPAQDQDLLGEILSFSEDPLGFVRYAYPWGVEGTPLWNKKGPRKWQVEELEELRDHIRNNRRLIHNARDPETYRKSIVSGRGTGKTAELCWLGHWLLSTSLGSTVIYTANTEAQLSSRTWPELGKWHSLSIHSHWFDRTATTLKPQNWFAAQVTTQMKIDCGYYYAQAQLWNEENPDAFAGAHNPLGMMVIFDEASGIPANIWKVTQGFFTDIMLHRYWHVSSNGRRNTGAFFETHHKHRDFWKRKQIDAREVEDTDQAVYNEIITEWGPESDEAKVEVYGQFPSQGDNQFMSRDLVEAAIEREVVTDRGAPLVMGVDVARFGNDHSVIRFRQGRDGRSIQRKRYKGLDNVQLAARVAEQADIHKPDAIFIGGGGPGGGVIDILKEMRYRVIEVDEGGKADDPVRYQNRRPELWGKAREWLMTGCIPDDEDLKNDLLGPEYHFTLNGQIGLESVEKMKKRGLPSPDDATALILTMDRPVSRKDTSRRPGGRMARDVDYPVL